MTLRPGIILALDQGTTSSRALIFDGDGRLLGSGHRDLPQEYPQPGWVEQDAEEIWRGQMAAAREALEKAGMTGADLLAIGVANQRETVLLWDAETSHPLGKAVSWQCRRTAGRCQELRRAGHEDLVRDKTGLRLDPYFSATKLEWLLRAHPEAQTLLARGRLRAGTIDSFLVWRLTAGGSHVTDFSNASRTMLFNLKTLVWDEGLLRMFGIPEDLLPHPVPSAGIVGYSDPALFGKAIPIAGLAGDQQAALFGQGCLAPGEAKNTYGTGSFLLLNVGAEPPPATTGLLSTVAWGLGPNRERVSYALEGSAFVAGTAVQWLRDSLGLIRSASEIGDLAGTVPDNGGVYFVPALAGLGAPFWDAAARGLLMGLTRSTSAGHIARATEEAICYQTRAIVDAMVANARQRPDILKVDGGASNDDFLMRLQADVLGIPLQRQELREATAFGAAALAGVGVGLWSLDDVKAMTRTEQVFHPSAEERELSALDSSYERWLQAVERSRGWAED